MKYFSGAWGAGRSRLIADILKKEDKSQFKLIVTSGRKQAELVYNELKFFLPNDVRLLSFPEYPCEPFEQVRVNPLISGIRHKTMYDIATDAKLRQTVVITTVYAAAKKIPTVEAFLDAIFTIRNGDILPYNKLVLQLDKLGYLPVEAVNGRGEYCIRGGIVDLYPITAENPVRIEFFDDEVDAIFSYSVETQRWSGNIDEITLLPASELLYTNEELLNAPLPSDIHDNFENFGKFAGHHWLLPLINSDEQLATIFDYIPKGSELIFFEEDYLALFERFLTSVDDFAAEYTPPAGCADIFVSLASARAICADFGVTVVAEVVTDDSAISCNYRSIKSRFTFEKGNIYTALGNALKEIKSAQADGYKTVISIESERFIKIVDDFCRDHEILIADTCNAGEIKAGALYLYKERTNSGFIDDSGKLMFVSDEDIFGFVRKRSRSKAKESFNTKISDLELGDFVVHVDYGIGIYNGLKHMVLGGIEGDYLQILYDNNELLFVPLDKINQIQKYIGVGDAKPKLSNLQTNTWTKLKASARKQAAKIAQDLLRLYAERKARAGFRFTAGGNILAEFEENFEYDETEDQLAAIMDTYRDMEKPEPMDRLVCGDVGYGKTEVAMRAACKAVLSGKQVAVLVPTTVLARQHYVTFKKRFEELPIKVDYISRFRKPKEIREVRDRLEDGQVDILIGTHRLLSADIIFKDLGLLIIDEEQRFGVADKEKIAAMRSNIDVLALSATPIPRTLQLSLSGVREISIIETPPENRQPVAVKVITHDDDVKKAIMRELERNGQIFFLHNRINDLHEVVDYVKKLAPGARVVSAHGQTPAKELENILTGFYDGEYDILISTTIIENGIDIPNVNSIFIDKASTFGLSQLYQLKGRVGRSSSRGYCYLLVDDMGMLTPIAQKRLSIIQQLSDLGSGLKIAMYDLQLRGAGDLLGAAQSGFATRVGFELFLKMIAEAVAELQEDSGAAHETEVITQLPHYIAADYLEDPKTRLDYYREFGLIKDREMLNELLLDLEGQFGEVRKETINLGYIMLIKNLASQLHIIKAGIYTKMLRLTFSAAHPPEPAMLTKLLTEMKAPYRFAGEYELVLTFPDENEMLKSGLVFLQTLLNIDEMAGLQ